MNLHLSDDGGGPRHYLDGRAINCGTQLLLKVNPKNTSQESWVWARYEASLHRGDVYFVLYTTFGVVSPDDTTVLRWPTEEER